MSTWYICTRKADETGWDCEKVEKDVATNYNRIFKNSKIIEVSSLVPSYFDKTIIQYKLKPAITIKKIEDCFFD